MLEECFHYLGVRTTGRGARLLGYAHEAAALQARHRRCRASWRPHVEATHKALLVGAASLPNPGGTALIVGGGIAQDLPMAQLLTHFERIILLDIAFAYPTRRLAVRWPERVFCCLHDVTGVVDWLAKHRRLPQSTMLNPPQLPDLLPRPDWVASVNCLTQIPLLPIDWLHDQGEDDGKLESFGRALMEAHLQWLSAWQSPVCLITEIEEQHFGQSGELIATIDYRPLLQAFLANAKCLADWAWCLNPPGETADGSWETRSVAAYGRG